MKRGGPLRRGKPLDRGAYELKRSGELRRSAPKPRKASPKSRSAPADPIPPHVTAALYVRSGGGCEARASMSCTGMGAHRHHRKLRGHGDHTLANLLHVCHVCHTTIHANVGRSYENGWLVRSWEDPAAVPVIANPTG